VEWPGRNRNIARGSALVVAAAVAWSTAPFFTRLLSFDSWSILFWRGLFGAAMIAAILVLLQGWNGLREFTRMDRNGCSSLRFRRWAWCVSSLACN
jgi:EamA domain-containing membrane protein RarD